MEFALTLLNGCVQAGDGIELRRTVLDMGLMLDEWMTARSECNSLVGVGFRADHPNCNNPTLRIRVRQYKPKMGPSGVV